MAEEKTVRWHPGARRRVALLTAVALIGAALAGFALIVAFYPGGDREAAQGHFETGRERFKAGDYDGAYEAFCAAVELLPEDSTFLKSAALAAYRDGRKPEARLFATRAWRHGARDRETLLLKQLDVGTRDRTRNLADAIRQAREIDDEANSLRLQADIYAEYGEHAKAAALRRELLALDPTPALATATADALLHAGREAEAFEFLEEQWQRSMLDPDGVALYLSLLIRRHDGSAPGVRADEIERIFAEAARRGLADDRIRFEHAMFRFFRLRLEETRAMLHVIREPTEDDADDQVRHNARLFLALLLLDREDHTGIDELEAMIEDRQGPWYEGEAHVYAAMDRLADGDSRALTELHKARRLIPGNVVVEWLLGRYHAARGELEVALKHYRQIGGLVAISPQVLFEKARVTARAGQVERARGTIERLHALHGPTKRSLLLLSTIAMRSGSRDFAATMDRVLDVVREDSGDPDFLAPQAHLALAARDFDRARVLFEMAARHDAGAGTELGAIRVLVAEGRYEEALAECERADGSDADLRALRALLLYHLDRTDEAIAVCEEGLEATDHLPLRGILGLSLLERGDRASARTQFELILAADPDHPAANFGMAVLHARAGEWQECLASLARGKDRLDRVAVRFALLEAIANDALGNRAKAISLCRQLLSKENAGPEPALLLARMHLRDGRGEKAREVLRASLIEHPKDGRTRYLLAFVHYLDGENIRSLELQRELLRDGGSPGERLVILHVRTLGAIGKGRDARAFLDEHRTALGPVDVAIQEAFLHRLEGDPERALAVLEPHLEHPLAAERWADLAIDVGQGKRVSETFADRGYPMEVWHRLSLAAERRGDYRLAEHLAEEALHREPDNPGLLNNWAWYAFQLPDRDLERILDACRTAYRDSPEQPAFVDTYAEVLLAADRHDEVVNLLNEHFDLTARSPQLLHHLARAHEAAGRRDEALKRYRDSRRLATASDDWPLRSRPDELDRKIAALADADIGD